MAQTPEGAIKAMKTIRNKYGKNYFVEIGKSGGTAKYKGKKGFAANPELARQAGLKSWEMRKLKESKGDK